MKHIFHMVDIHVFDVHTTVKPLMIKDYVQPGLEFLVNEELYKEQHKSRQVLETDHFKIKPLKYNSRQYNHFWKNYMNVWPEKRDYWKLQIPFVCEPIDTNLDVGLSDSDFELNVRSVIYISALGWSTNLRLRLKGNMKLEQIRNLIGKLRSKDESGLMFELQGDRHNLSGVFKHLSDKIRRTLYKPGGPVPEKLDATNVHRHFVVSLTNFTGSIYFYKNKWRDHEQRMSNSDQALLHSVLHGRPIDVKEFAHLTRANKFSVVHFTGPDLALSYFELGTLVFLQQSAAKNTRTISMRCLASNIGSCSMMTLIFLYFHTQAKKLAGSNPTLKALLTSIEENLGRMPERYTNKFCDTLYSNHSDLIKIRSRLNPDAK